MLGLARTKVDVVPYDPKWVEGYRLAEAEIHEATPHIEFLIEHIGSTSVPGLAAKPIIDIGHLHAYLPGAPDWDRYLIFRERLRANTELREQYGSLKHEFAVRYAQDRLAYMEAKTEFVEHVLSGDSASLVVGPYAVD